MKIAISSGHGLYVSGTKDLIDEVTEARKVTDRVALILKSNGIDVNVFHDNTSRTQNDNINTIIKHHNSLQRNLDVSIHFNSSDGGTKDAGLGVETLYHTGEQPSKQIASKVSRKISGASGLNLRREDGTLEANTGIAGSPSVKFLKETTAPAILIEVCFVNSRTDVRLYKANFEAICHAVAESISGQDIPWEGGFMTESRPFIVNGKPMAFESVIINDRTFSMIKPVIEALGGTVGWDGTNVIIDMPKTSVSFADAAAKVTPDMWRRIEEIIKEAK